MEVFFLPPRNMPTHFVDKFLPVMLESAQILVSNASILPCRPHDALVPVFNRHRDKSILFQRCNVGANLPLTDAEKVGKVAIGRKASALIVERMDFHK